MVCLLLKHLTLGTLAFLFMNPILFLSPYFVHNVGAAAGYDTCQFKAALHVIHHDVEVNMLNETT